jgi:hypothetical protein
VPTAADLAVQEPLVKTPYISPPEFIAYPNYLDLSDLIPNGSAAQQTAELTNVLLRVTGMVRSYCRMPLGAESVTDTKLTRLDRSTGMAAVKLSARPFVRVTAIRVKPWAVPGAVPVSIDPANVDAPVRGRLYVPLYGGGLSGAVPTGPAGRVLVTVTYEAGYPCTVLAQPAAQGAAQVTVTNPVALLPGVELRLWDPGVEEPVTVADSYRPGSAVVPLTGPLLAAHTAGAAIDALPGDAREAFILWAMGVLARPTSGGDMDAFSDSHGEGPLTTGSDPRRTGAGLIAAAKELLDEGGFVQAW